MKRIFNKETRDYDLVPSENYGPNKYLVSDADGNPRWEEKSGGSGYDAVIRVSDDDRDMSLQADANTYTLEGMTSKEICDMIAAGRMPRICLFKPFYYGDGYSAVYNVFNIVAGQTGGSNYGTVQFSVFDKDGCVIYTICFNAENVCEWVTEKALSTT